ncbi:hypothetical protein N7535_004246 [Penicillium sp. DV-2018c]|nr:hypothetical protein N7535_004246 [Penicillium sp. DV-2018c]
MPKTDQPAESRMIQACEAAKREGNRNLSEIARQYCIPRRTVHSRVKNGVPSRQTVARTGQFVPGIDQPAESRMIQACEAILAGDLAGIPVSLSFGPFAGLDHTKFGRLVGSSCGLSRAHTILDSIVEGPTRDAMLTGNPAEVWFFLAFSRFAGLDHTGFRCYGRSSVAHPHRKGVGSSKAQIHINGN